MTASGSSCAARNRRSAARPASSRASSCSRLTKPSFDQADVEDLVELRLGHDVAPGMAVVEQLDGLVQRRAVDDRVVRRQRHAQDVGVLVLERTGQVVVDLVEAQRQRLVIGPVRGGRCSPSSASNAASRSTGVLTPRAGAGDAGGGRQVERLQHERRDASRAGAAVVRGVRQDQLVAGPGHRHVAEAPLLGERRLGRRAARRDRARPAGPASRRGRSTGNRPATRPGRKTTGNSRPLALWTVRTATASASGSSSAVAGSSPASMSVSRCGATKTARSSASSADCARTISKNRATFWSRFLGRRRVRRGQPREHPARRAGTGTAARRPAARGPPPRSHGGPRRADATVARVSGPTRRMPGCRSSSSSTAQTERFRRRAMLTMAVRSSPPSAVDLGRGQGVQVDARIGVGDDAQEGEQQPDLGPGVQPRRPGEPPRDARPC